VIETAVSISVTSVGTTTDAETRVIATDKEHNVLHHNLNQTKLSAMKNLFASRGNVPDPYVWLMV
jgi:hypothetical protein